MKEHTIKSKYLIKVIYADIKETIECMKSDFELDNPKKAAKELKSNSYPSEFLTNVQVNEVVISTELSILDKLKISPKIRDLEFEKEAREWAFVSENADCF